MQTQAEGDIQATNLAYNTLRNDYDHNKDLYKILELKHIGLNTDLQDQTEETKLWEKKYNDLRENYRVCKLMLFERRGASRVTITIPTS